MKRNPIVSRLTTLFSILILATISFNCQDKAGADLINEAARSGVSLGAYSGFKTAFPSARSVTWNRLQDRIWEARFTEGTTAKVALLQTSGVVVEQGVLLSPDSVPAITRTHLSETFPGSSIHTVLTDVDDEANKPWRVILLDATNARIWRVLFNSDGTFHSATEL
ncbi:hypothetical protein [Larkinella humicola]|uniref:PepSY-like beta-lactamase-inhibitor n=1 Tax=Larkinella humicola TaxID=2607654 RepID=A0A5N1JH27_9BACT|nr:hypothetical protein [Larkinella humicola]KAA9353797.1 hypothetical protein F0P93_14305 [Larkinella humicola]